MTRRFAAVHRGAISRTTFPGCRQCPIVRTAFRAVSFFDILESTAVWILEINRSLVNGPGRPTPLSITAEASKSPMDCRFGRCWSRSFGSRYLVATYVSPTSAWNFFCIPKVRLAGADSGLLSKFPILDIDFDQIYWYMVRMDDFD